MGLALAMHADPDVDTNDTRFAGDLVPKVRELIGGPRLFLVDSAFCDLTQTAHLTADPSDEFLVRYHPKVHFYRDPERPVRQGRNQRNRLHHEEWGWLESPKNKSPRSVVITPEVTLEHFQSEWTALRVKTRLSEPLGSLWRDRWKKAPPKKKKPPHPNKEKRTHGSVFRISGGTDSPTGGRCVERMLSVMATCRQQDRNVLDYLTSCLEANRPRQPSPSLLPAASAKSKAA